MENRFDAKLRLNLNSWLRSCSADWDERQQALFLAVKRDLGSGVRVEDRQVDLAMIGGPDLLRYLWQKHEVNSDYSVRKAIVENRLCQPDLLAKALRDRDWEVRRIAVRRPETPVNDIIRAAKREGSDVVLEAMQERLGDLFPERDTPRARGMAMASPYVSIRDVMEMQEDGLAVAPFGNNWEGANGVARELEIVRYLKGQGHPHPDVDGTLDEFMEGGEFQALYDEAVQNDYSLMDLDIWIHLTKILGDLKFDTAMGIAEVLDEKEGIAVLELPLPAERLVQEHEDTAAKAGGEKYTDVGASRCVEPLVEEKLSIEEIEARKFRRDNPGLTLENSGWVGCRVTFMRTTDNYRISVDLALLPENYRGDQDGFQLTVDERQLAHEALDKELDARGIPWENFVVYEAEMVGQSLGMKQGREPSSFNGVLRNAEERSAMIGQGGRDAVEFVKE